MNLVWIVVGVIGVIGFVLLLWHYHRQQDFESSGHVVPEKYE